MRIDQLKRYRKLVIASIIICMIVLLFVPMYAYWIPEAFKEGQVVGWNDVLMINDELFQIIIPCFYVLFLALLFIKIRIIRLILKLILFLNGGFLFLLGIMSGMPAQDYSPGYGTLISFGMSILLGVMFLLDWSLTNEKVKFSA